MSNEIDFLLIISRTLSITNLLLFLINIGVWFIIGMKIWGRGEP